MGLNENFERIKEQVGNELRDELSPMGLLKDLFLDDYDDDDGDRWEDDSYSVKWPRSVSDTAWVFNASDEQEYQVGISENYLYIANEEKTYSDKKRYSIHKEDFRNITLSGTSPQVAAISDYKYTWFFVSFNGSTKTSYKLGFKNGRQAIRWEECVLRSKPVKETQVSKETRAMREQLTALILSEGEKTAISKEDERFRCADCKTELNSEKDVFCPKCGRQILPSERTAWKNRMDGSCHKYTITAEGFGDLLKGWNKKADALFDEALAIDIRLGEAYLGKLLIQLGIKKIDELSLQTTVLKENALFDNALRYSMPRVVKQLKAYEKIVKSNAKDVKKAEKYNEKVALLRYYLETFHVAENKDQQREWTEKWGKLRVSFGSFNGYKDSYEMMKVCDEKIAESQRYTSMLPRAPFFERARKWHKKMKKKASKWWF